MKGLFRFILFVAVLLLIVFVAADFVLSGRRFTWPPPPQMSIASFRTQLSNLFSPPPPEPPSDLGHGSGSGPGPSEGGGGGTETASTGPTESDVPPPPERPVPHVVLPPCEDEVSGTAAIAFVEGRTEAYCPSGTMLPQRGSGKADMVDNAPGIRFPIEQAPAYANSQVYGMGGNKGAHPTALQGDPPNYQYPWHDDFCETRSHSMQVCPAGVGHQGQDIRPSLAYDPKLLPAKKLYRRHFYVVAVEDGYISHVGSFMLTLYGDSGNKYDYLHMDFEAPYLLVAAGDTVKRGQPIGYVSNNFGTSATTFHLHFQVRGPVQSSETGDSHSAWIYMSPYMALVNSYSRLLNDQEEAWPDRAPPANP